VITEVITAVKAFFGLGGAGEATRVRLSTIHRAKGGEAARVYILQPEHIPWPFGNPRDAEQERNLEYVAKTRAKAELVFLVHCESNYGALNLNPLFEHPAVPPREEGDPPRRRADGAGGGGGGAASCGAAATAGAWTPDKLMDEAPKDFDNHVRTERFLRRFLRQTGLTGSLAEWDRRQLVVLCERERAAWEVRRVLACPVTAARHAAVLRLSPSSPRGGSGGGGVFSEKEVKDAFRTVSLSVHPDKNRTEGADEAVARVYAARDALLLRGKTR
jgi:hypothetical protein